MAWVLFFAGLWLLLAVHLGLLALGSHWAKMEPEAIQLGVGPTLLERTIRGVALRVGALPLGGSVPLRRPDASVGSRLVPVVLAGGLTTAIGVAMLGVTPSLDVARDALVLPVTGALSPGDDAQRTLARIVGGISAGRYGLTFGTSAVAVGIWNLVMGTAMAVSTLHRGLQAVAAFVTIALSLPWIYAWVVYLL